MKHDICKSERRWKMEPQVRMLIPRSAYLCGGCNFSANSLSELHKHLTEHYEGGNYYYHHSLRTAFPKHDLVCTGSQTYDDLSVTTATQTEECEVLAKLMSLDVKSVLSIDTQTDFCNAELGRIGDSSITNVFGQPNCDYLNSEKDFFSIGPKKEVDDRLSLTESDENTVVVKKEIISKELTDDEHDFQYSDNNVTIQEDSSSTDDYKRDELESYLSFNSRQDSPPVHEETHVNRKISKKKRKLAHAVKGNEGSKVSKHKKSSVDRKQNKACVRDEINEKISKKSSFREDKDLYKCLVCYREFAYWKSWSLHIESQHYDTYPDKCQQCFLIYKSPDEASSHDCETARQFNHVCWQCPKPLCFRWSETIRLHLQDMHKGVLPSSCTYCNLKFVSEFDLNCHMTEHDPSLLTCPVCKKAMATYVNLKSHIMLHKRKHICERCGKCFSKRESFKHHVWACIGKFACHECNKTFCTNRRLKCHMLIHTGERPFICEQCGQPFRSKEGLKSHKKFIHLGEKNYKCNECDKSFTTANTLKRHERVHMKIRPFACEFCSKQCSTKWNLDAHMRQHNGKKPYTCNICGVAFAHNVARKNHEAKCTFKVNYSDESAEWISGGNTVL